jgi:tetratricopeptide (TPR) repeat protein
MTFVQQGQYEPAVTAFTEILHRQLRQYGPRHAATASAYHNLGTVHAKHAMAVAAAAADDNNNNNSPLLLQNHHSRTTLTATAAAALECFQAAARSARDAPTLGPDHPNVAVSLVRVGFCLLQAKSYGPALITFTEALRIRNVHYGHIHPLVANVHNNLGVCHMHLGEFEAGRAALQEALTIQRRLLLVNNNDEVDEEYGDENNKNTTGRRAGQLLELSDTLFNVGGLCLEWIRQRGPDVRRAVEAELAFAEALTIRQSLFHNDDPMVQQVQRMLTTAQAVPRPRTPTISTTTMTTMTARQQQQQRQHQHHHAAAATTTTPTTSTGRQLPLPPWTSPLLQKYDHHHKGPATAAAAAAGGHTHDDSNLPISPLQPQTKGTSESIFRRTTPTAYRNNTNMIEQHQDPPMARRSTSAEAVAAGRRTTTKAPPLLEIAVSKDQDPTNDLYEERLLDHHNNNNNHQPPPQRMKMMLFQNAHSQHHQSDDDDNNNDDAVNQSDAALGTGSFEKDTFVIDTSDDQIPLHHHGQSPRRQSPPPHQSIVDGEESCLISESGIDSEQGTKIHFPLAWTKAHLRPTTDPTATSTREYVVSRPSREAQSRVRARVRKNNGGGHATAAANDTTTAWNHPSYSTGNKERDSIMARARAILYAHGPETNASHNNNNNTMLDSNNNNTGVDDEMPDDGLAPLGGDWGQKENKHTNNNNANSSSRTKPLSVAVMLQNPALYLVEIFDEAVRSLQANEFADAQRLFEVVLDCQRHRHGRLHPDVAAALHNIGITHLRSNNHSAALQAFEESCRVRKGSLGKDHPLVAVRGVALSLCLSVWCFFLSCFCCVVGFC